MLGRMMGIGHDKFSPKIFATPPQSVTFVIRLPALRTADWQFSPTTSWVLSHSTSQILKMVFMTIF